MVVAPASVLSSWQRTFAAAYPGLRVVLPGAETMHVDWFEEDLVSWFNVKMHEDGHVGADLASLGKVTARIVATVQPFATRFICSTSYFEIL